MLTLAQGFMVFGSRLIRDRIRHLVNQGHIPGCGNPDRLGKHGRSAGTGNAMQGLIPPVIGRYTQPFNRNGIIQHGADLLSQSHSGDQVPGAVPRPGIRVQIKGFKVRSVGQANLLSQY